MMTLMRVGAVGNAVSAFSKALWAPLCASTTPAASMRSESSLSPPRGLNPSGPFIEAAEANRTEMEIPLAVIHGLQPNPFADQHRTDHDRLRVPRHHARRGHAAYFVVSGINHRRQPARQRPRRGLIEASRRPLPQGFVRALLVVPAAKARKPLLLRDEIRRGRPRRLRLQRAMHPLVRPVLIG